MAWNGHFRVRICSKPHHDLIGIEIADQTVMKTALSITNNRLAPLFDVSRHLLILDWEDGMESARSECCARESALSTLAELKRQGVGQLVCGAISRPMQHAALSMGIEVFGFLTGELNRVVEAIIKGRLLKEELNMPGCRGMGRGCGRGRRRNQA